MGLLRTILFIALIYFLWRLVTVFVIYPFVKGYSGGGGNRGKGTEFRNSRKKEGDVTIDYLSKHDKMVNKDKGEYVDYEELDD